MNDINSASGLITVFTGCLDVWADEAIKNVDEIRTKTNAPGAPLAVILGKWNPNDDLDGKDLPKEVRSWIFDQFRDLPSWIDLNRVAKIQRRFKDVHWSGARIVIPNYSLPLTYIDDDIVRALSSTGRLMTHIRDRLYDTLSFAESVTELDSLKCINSVGRLWLGKVRLTHALVRQKLPSLQASGEKHYHLDQVQTAFVLLTFSYAVVDGLAKMGWRMSDDDANDYIYLWAVIGYFMGVDEKLLPRSVDGDLGAKALFEFMVSKNVGDWKRKKNQCYYLEFDVPLQGKLLTAAALTFIEQVLVENVPKDLQPFVSGFQLIEDTYRQLPRIVMRRLCGRDVSRLLGISRAPMLYWLLGSIFLPFYPVREIHLTFNPKASPKSANSSQVFGLDSPTGGSN
jgi:ER-bound oxygenase mpaB/B'/Rubber oxygenase, catalytic domain